ncbi:uncharacterized protein LOC132611925 [Lycium barbarum]|uniref:uncharacterized protein LOC132611925 n=1 Tax=Lycium barbarum TaxID=112863 RepID=UPI00293E1E46|nr:uncharacterized protein LOC132611925 [Lycium barbarum]
MVRIRDTPAWRMYMRLASPVFTGAPGEDAYKFIVSMHEILHTAGITDTLRFYYVTHRFRGGAKAWWRDNLASRQAGAHPLTWEQFYGVFLARYVPCSQRDERRGQLFDLRQKGMLVATYALSFSYLDRHSYPLIPTETGRIWWLISGLDGSLQLPCVQLEDKGTSFQAIVDCAATVEAAGARAARPQVEILDAAIEGIISIRGQSATIL